jgi:hypothetical protein
VTVCGYSFPWLFRRRAALVGLAFALTLATACDPPTATVIATGYASPVHVEADGDDLLVVEKLGRIWRQTPDGARTLWLDLSARVCQCPDGEQGLLAVALRPDGSGDFAVFYQTPSNVSRVSIFEGGLERVLVEVPQTAPHHKGGTVEWGPDGLLWVGFGDDGTPANAQDLSTFKGKLVQIDPATGAAEIYARGLRNPYRFSFDSLTGDLYVTDVGSTLVEEINVLMAGHPASADINFGWPEWEGRTCKTPPCSLDSEVFPSFSYANDAGTCAVIGGFVHRGSIPFLGEIYTFADLCGGRVWGTFGASSTSRFDLSSWANLATQAQIVAIEPDGQGRPIVVRFNGTLLRIE